MKNRNSGEWLTLSFQHMFAMFGATILVPQLVGLSPAIALLTSGIATIVFILVTQFKVPAYLGSSFAFIIPIQIATAEGGIGSAMIGSMFVAAVYAIISLLIWKTGHKLDHENLTADCCGACHHCHRTCTVT